MDLGLVNRSAVVTGGASGIGRAAVEALLSEGARVFVIDREPGIAEIARELDSEGHCRGGCVDITDFAAVQWAAANRQQVTT